MFPTIYMTGNTFNSQKAKKNPLYTVKNIMSSFRLGSETTASRISLVLKGN
jgi:hypothetical protein